MIREGMLAVALVVAGSTSASAETVFFGTIKITAVTPQCQNVSVGHTDNSVFHPKIAGNVNFSGLTFVYSVASIGYSVNGVAFDAIFRNVVAGGFGWGNLHSWTGSQIRIVSQSPATITNTTPTVTLRGQIRKHNNDNGGTACVVSFLGVYVKDSNQ